jgi:ABC-type uncharacterized transport system substrate-binding protein
MSDSTRRMFITLLGGVAAAWPLAARGQQAERMRRIGVLLGLAENDPETESRVAALRKGLHDLGWIDGRNVQMDYRFAPATVQVQALANELVALQPDVIFTNSTMITLTLQRASRALPIVFLGVSDPVGAGFVKSLAHPGGNLTGLLNFEPGIIGKWLAMLREIAPRLARVAFIANPTTTAYDYLLRGAKAAALSLAIELVPSPVENSADIERVIGSFGRVPNGGV